jgi:hypothetical protein
MKNRLAIGTVTLALISGIGGATAQLAPSGQPDPAQIKLDATQKAAIVTAVRDNRIPPPSVSFNISVGAQVPASVELHALPIAALSQAPEVKHLRYTMVQSQVVLVDPLHMRVVDVIQRGQ